MRKRWWGAAMGLILGLCASISMTGEVSADSQNGTVRQYMDCMDPMPVIGNLSDTCWGAEAVGARDQDNGLEDREMEKYSYWDGGIIRDEETGKYYMFASRWNQAGGHWGQDGISGWQGSQAIYAVSDSLYGPYEDQGPIWPDWCEGAGHNVFPFKLSQKDALYEMGYRYAISISDTGMHGDVANGTLHISKSLDGPWELVDNDNAGKLKTQGGDFSLSNISIMVRPDGKYEATNRNGDIALADSIAGTWEVKENGLWWKISGMSSENIEDPVIWYSDGLYHIVVNKWDARMAYYLTSEDGITNWKRHPGTAYRPDGHFLRYEDGTENHWTKLERPNIYVEDGKIVAMTFAVIDVQKEEDFGNDQHGSKVIVVPFSSDKLIQLDAQPDPLDSREGICALADSTAQSWGSEIDKNYGAENFLQIQKDVNFENHGMGSLGEGSRPDEWYDNKISYVKFDLSEYEMPEGSALEKVYLSLIYQDKAAGDAEETAVQAVLSEAGWQEGTGKESENGNQAAAKDLTWSNQPSLSYGEDTIVLSEKFRAADLGCEVRLDVTNLFEKFRRENPGENVISFALNATATGSRFRLVSREAGERTAPRLMFQWKEPEPTPTPTPTDVPESVTPAKVENLRAVSTKKAVKLSWSKVRDAGHYQVFFLNPKTGKYEKAAVVNKTTYTHKKRTPASAYSYKVCAVSRDGKSGACSKTVKILTRPGVTKITSLKRKGKDAVIWFKKVTGANAYYIYRYNAKKKKYETAYRIQNKKVFSYKKGKYVKTGNAKLAKKVFTASLKTADKGKYIVKAVKTKKGYKTVSSAASKKAKLK